MDEMIKVCSTCKYYPRVAHCNGCRYDGRVNGNTKWEPKRAFINKPCVSEKACHEDKMNVLEKIKTEIADMEKEFELRHDYPRADTLKYAISVINKYAAESGDKE